MQQEAVEDGFVPQNTMNSGGAGTDVDERQLLFYIINAFVHHPLGCLTQGNPAAVVLLPPGTHPMTDSAQQSIAAQMNLSETAFVNWNTDDEARTFRIRWFTPTIEVDLCGHATLAAAAALVAAGAATPQDGIRLQTMRKGTLQINFPDRPVDGKRHRFVSMSFPAIHTQGDLSSAESARLLSALGIMTALRVLRTEFDLAVVLPNAQAVANVAPDMRLLREIDVRGVIVCAREGTAGEPVLTSRFFAPRAGIDEDPVTGSAHCVLATMFLQPGQAAVCTQQSERGGRVDVRRGEGEEADRVEIGGCASIVAEGKLFA